MYIVFLVFQLGFEQSEYEIGEGEGLVNDTIYIIKLNENILQMHYNLTISVLHSDGPYPAVLGKFYFCIIILYILKNYSSNTLTLTTYTCIYHLNEG